MNADLLTEYAYTLLANREFTRAEAAFRQIVEFSAESAWGHPGIGLAQIAQKRFDEAEVNAQRGSVAWARDFVLTMAQWGKGRVADAEEALHRLIAQAGDVAAYQIACAYAQRGDADRAFEWLERAHRQRDPGLSWSKADYFLSAVHDNPRWPAFLRQLGLHDEQLRK